MFYEQRCQRSRFPVYSQRNRLACVYGCKNIKNITLPKGLESIGAECFMNTVVKKAVIPGSVKKIQCSVFSKCRGKPTIVLGEGIEELEEECFCESEIKDIKIPKSVKKIQMYAFDHCDELESVTL